MSLHTNKHEKITICQFHHPIFPQALWNLFFYSSKWVEWILLIFILSTAAIEWNIKKKTRRSLKVGSFWWILKILNDNSIHLGMVKISLFNDNWGKVCTNKPRGYNWLRFLTLFQKYFNYESIEQIAKCMLPNQNDWFFGKYFSHLPI